MSSERQRPAATPCLCSALRQSDRAVSRLYDEELRGAGLRTTQYAMLRRLSSAGEVCQRDLGGLVSLDETTVTRNLRLLIDAGWVAVRPGRDRREKLVRLTDAGATKLREARPAWERAQERMRARLPAEKWSTLMGLLPELTQLADSA